ncbi:MAG: hypothetical protein KC422_05360 [Trueperaceae bacterium]|nr:hypothetical protein [Trueperaceae bacterium]
MKRLWILLLAVAFLSACQQDQQLDVQGRKFQNPKYEPTCLIDELEANPAAYHRSGSSNGMAFKDGPIISEKYLTDANDLALQLATVFPVAQFSKDMVLIIADDFGAAHNGGKSVYRVSPEIYKLDFANFGDPLMPAAAYDAMDAYFKNLLQTGQNSHGAQVLTLSLDLFSSLGATLQGMTDDQVRLELNGYTVVLRALEVGGMNTAQIKTALETTINSYKALGYEDMVVNMSWTLEFCKAVAKFRRSKANSFDKYLTATPPGIGPGDPLYDYLNAEDNRHIVYLAAAGNYGGNQPRQPGLMPQVISTSAQFAGTNVLALFSNSGEVMLDGAYLRLRDPYNRNKVGQEANAALLVGTSYSAPANAIASLLDLGSSPLKCGFDDSGPRLAHGSYSNPSLAAAVSTYCP